MKEKVSTRNGNIELLRIMLMLGIISHHLLGHGGFLGRSTGAMRWVLAALKCIAYPSVNCFVIITGYFQSQQRFKLRKVISIVIQLLFWTLVFYAMYLLLGCANSPVKFIKALFPYLLGGSWFTVEFIALYLLSPFLNAMIRALNKAQSLTLLALLLVLTCTPGYSARLDISGHSLSWMLTLYYIGAMIRKYPPRKRTLLLLGLGGAAVALIYAWVSMTSGYPEVKVIAESARQYNSLVVLCSAAVVFMIFAQMPEHHYPRWVYRLSSTTFGIYLIHDNDFVRDLLWGRWVAAVLPDQVTLSHLWIYAAVVLSVFIVCALLELGRMQLFRLTHLDSVPAKIEAAILRRLPESISECEQR